MAVAGLGTRLLTMSMKMSSIFIDSSHVGFCLKPMIQAVLEQLYVFRFQEFGFITGRRKRINDSTIVFIKALTKKLWRRRLKSQIFRNMYTKGLRCRPVGGE